jgi:hypothetical protein
VLSVEVERVLRRYPRRPARGSAGDRLDKDLAMDTTTATLRFAWPLWRGLRATTSVNRSWATANNPDSAVFRYHYDTMDVRVGLSYEY